MQFIPGLVSITFRQLLPEQVIAVAAEAGVLAIEWGGDVHCPHGDTQRAGEVAAMTRAAGLVVGAYGSYYRLGVSEEQGLSFDAVLASAVALGAPRIRIWAGNEGSATTSAEQRGKIVADAQRVAQLAAPRGIRVVSEWHGWTLTDTAASGTAFLREVGHANFATIWQPAPTLPVDQALAELGAVLPWLDHLHVFHWDPERRPLAEGAANWRRYLACAATTGRDLIAAIEFVLGDDPAQLTPDAAALNAWIAQLAG